MWPWLAALVGGLLLVAALYWLLVLTEGAYLGSGTVTTLYNRFARRYDAIKQFDDEDEAYFLGRPVARFLADFPTANGQKPWLLDVATGTGRLPLTVLRASEGGCAVLALDNSVPMLQQAHAKLHAQGWQDVVLLAANAQPLPFASGQFAVTTCLEALEFMPNPAQMLPELLRVTQPGGLLVLTNRIGRDARLMPGRSMASSDLNAALRALGAGAVEVLPWQMDYDLLLAVKQGRAAALPERLWQALLRCPHCQQPPDAAAGPPAQLICPRCGWTMTDQAGLWQAGTR